MSAPVPDGIYVVGCFEDFRLDVFPTHVLPIIAEIRGGAYQRWNYIVRIPYRIELIEPVGIPRPTPAEMFPVLTYHLYPPQRITPLCQVIALSREEVLVTPSIWRIALRMVLEMVRHRRDGDAVDRARITIYNASPFRGEVPGW